PDPPCGRRGSVRGVRRSRRRTCGAVKIARATGSAQGWRLPRLDADVTHDVIDALTFSSVWVAVAATTLAMAASGALHVPATHRLLTFVFAGTILVYQLDRLRDLARDRETSPLRTAFVERHRRALQTSVALAGVAALACLPAIGRRGMLVAAVVLAL